MTKFNSSEIHLVPATDENLVASFPVHEHLGFTSENMLAICRSLWEGDPVLAHHQRTIVDYQAKIADYQARESAFRATVRDFEQQEDELLAQLKNIRTSRKEARGHMVGMRYHADLAQKRISERVASINKRKKQLFLNDAQKRLRALGKTLKRKLGKRAEAGLPTAVVPLEE